MEHCSILALAVWRFRKQFLPHTRARHGVVALPRENPSKVIFSPRLIDPLWYFAYASNRNRRQIEVRVPRTLLRWMVARLDGDALQFNTRNTVDQSG